MPAKKRTSPKAPLGISYDQSRSMLIISVGLLLLALVLLLQAYRVENRSTNTPVAKPHTAVGIAQPISMGAVEMKVDSVSFNAGSEPFRAPTGKAYAVVTLEIKNKSDKPIQVMPSSDMYMKNTAGEVAYLSPANLTDPFRAGELSPGERIKGGLSFLTDTTSDYKFYIDAIWSGGVIPFAVKN